MNVIRSIIVVPTKQQILYYDLALDYGDKTWAPWKDGSSKMLRNVGILPYHHASVTTQKTSTWIFSAV